MYQNSTFIRRTVRNNGGTSAPHLLHFASPTMSIAWVKALLGDLIPEPNPWLTASELNNQRENTNIVTFENPTPSMVCETACMERCIIAETNPGPCNRCRHCWVASGICYGKRVASEPRHLREQPPSSLSPCSPPLRVLLLNIPFTCIIFDTLSAVSSFRARIVEFLRLPDMFGGIYARARRIAPMLQLACMSVLI